MDKPTRYWFPAKRYGWGWGPPGTWQGWVVVGVWLIAFIVGARHFAPARLHLAPLLGFVVLMAALLTLVCYIKGEPPRWRWGGD
ncbi:MAG TPA: hypothetical protein VHY75_15390 [Steroidobacteraceae bacterium]|jgi:hypothetical protein|nr:hypothetical protein [Steroidobacteraceae bacterium]